MSGSCPVHAGHREGRRDDSVTGQGSKRNVLGIELMEELSMTLAQIKREKERTDIRLYGMALTLIETRARKILAAHSNLDEFVMAMGGWLFTKKGSDDNISDVYREHIPSYARSFLEMMDEFNDIELKVTGEPMRFTATGPVVRMWGGTDGLDGTAVAQKYLAGEAYL